MLCFDHNHVTVTDLYLLEFLHVLLDLFADVCGRLQVVRQLFQNDGVHGFVFRLH